MAGIRLESVNKIYPNGFHAVKNLDLECADHEFMVLLGPSGCGKTSLLRMIAGLEEISSGRVYIGNDLVNEVEAKDRDVAMVFQNYALYPHMTVFDNLAFALRLRKMDKPAIRQRVYQVANMLDIEDLLAKRPRQLSGGQMQRVALGRAIVREPRVFLMDEPLSNLDMQLRVQMRLELINMHRTLGTTFIYVTHDQLEAMTMATTIVVMKNGIVQQTGFPLEVYENPRNMFVAGFIGSPAMNLLEAQLQSNAGHLEVAAGELRLRVPYHRITPALAGKVGKPIILGIRPEDVYCSIPAGGSEGSGPTAQVDIIEPLGNESYIHLTLGGQRIEARIPRSLPLHPNDMVHLDLAGNNIHLFCPVSEEALLSQPIRS